MVPKKLRLQTAVLICGSAVMIFEIIGSRIVAPYVGVSTYVWTSLIGVVLASLSIGYAVGGKLADSKPQVAILSKIILAASWAIIVTILIKDPLASFIQLSALTLELKTLVIALALFAPAGFLLGMVLPFAVKLISKDLDHIGQTTGTLYALSTFGSIAGTFLAGFYLVPNLGSHVTLFILTLLLVIASALVLDRTTLRIGSVLAIALTVAFSIGVFIFFRTNRGETLIADIDTKYSRVQILSGTDAKTGEPVRYLSNDPFGFQSGIFTEKSEEPLFEITKYFGLVGYFAPQPYNTLMLGGSTYTFPRYFLKEYPESTMDVVEIDPEVTELARTYFDFTDSPRLQIFHEDARVFLNRNQKRYDAIIVDVFNSGISIPFHLTTIETMRKIFDSLGENGVLLMNIVSALEGEKGKLFRAEYATLKKVFPEVLVFPISKNKGLARQNILVVALKSPKEYPPSADENIREQLTHIWNKPIPNDVPILTDDFAPVDYYMRKSI